VNVRYSGDDPSVFIDAAYGLYSETGASPTVVGGSYLAEDGLSTYGVWGEDSSPVLVGARITALHGASFLCGIYNHNSDGSTAAQLTDLDVYVAHGDVSFTALASGIHLDNCRYAGFSCKIADSRITVHPAGTSDGLRMSGGTSAEVFDTRIEAGGTHRRGVLMLDANLSISGSEINTFTSAGWAIILSDPNDDVTIASSHLIGGGVAGSVAQSRCAGVTHVPSVGVLNFYQNTCP
jgi:hypothetical protein